MSNGLDTIQRNAVKVLARQGADAFWLSMLLQTYFVQSIDVEVDALYAEVAAEQAAEEALMAAQDAAIFQAQQNEQYTDAEWQTLMGQQAQREAVSAQAKQARRFAT